MKLRRVLFLAGLMTVIAGSCYANDLGDPGINMRGGAGSLPFTSLNFNVTLDATGRNCVNNPGCYYKNATGLTITEMDFNFNVPQPPSGTYFCGIDLGTNSPFSACALVFTPDATNPTEVAFRFYNGDLPVGGEFGLDIPPNGAFPPNTVLAATAIPSKNSVPEPSSIVLLLLSLAGTLVAWLRTRRGEILAAACFPDRR